MLTETDADDDMMDGTASAAAYDIHGRPRAMRFADGTRTETVYDAFGRATEMTSLDAAGTLTGQTPGGEKLLTSPFLEIREG